MKRTDRHGLSELITEPLLQKEAGDRAYERGLGYFHAGAVTDLVVTDETLNACVEGGDEYAVQLWNEDGALGHSCTCPVGDDGIFCKHAVAAGLAWLADRKAAPPARRGRDDMAAIREWLAGAPREQLVELLLEQTLNDPSLRSRLNACAARASATHHVDVKALKETVGKALAVSGFADGTEARAARQGGRGGGFVDYHGMRGLIERAVPAVELIAGLIEDGHAAVAVELAHYALKRGIAAYQRIDDSGGGFGDLLHEIAALHLKACQAAPPEPAAFGKQFFELQMLDDWGLAAFADYAPFLGEAGLRAFRALAEKEWKKVPARGLGDDDRHASTVHFADGIEARAARHDCMDAGGRATHGAVAEGGRDSGFRIAAIMEALAHHAGDTDALVAIKSRDLTLPYHFLGIAEILAEAGRRDEALDWAERGHKTFPDRPDSRLVDFLADEYGRRGRHEEAVALTWEQFNRQPTLTSYQRLKTCAARAGTWTERRAKALAWLREDFLKPEKRERSRWSRMSHDHSLLVEIYLWEGDSDTALAEASAGGCTESLWFAIAKARETEHPQDAVAIYQGRLDNIVKQANNRAYDEAANLVARIRDLMRRTTQEKEFSTWLEAVRVRHKAKRNFMQRLDETLRER